MFFAYRSILIVLSSLSVYAFILVNFKKKSESKILFNLAELSFGIYLLHGIFLDITKKLFDYYSMNPIYSILLLSIIIFVVTALVVKILRKISIFKKYL
jgi:surface polysaccharide O-acyltransferase-like enzyme